MNNTITIANQSVDLSVFNGEANLRKSGALLPFKTWAENAGVDVKNKDERKLAMKTYDGIKSAYRKAGRIAVGAMLADADIAVSKFAPKFDKNGEFTGGNVTFRKETPKAGNLKAVVEARDAKIAALEAKLAAAGIA